MGRDKGGGKRDIGCKGGVGRKRRGEEEEEEEALRGKTGYKIMGGGKEEVGGGSERVGGFL